MIFEPQRLFVKSGPAHLIERLLSRVSPPVACNLADTPEELAILISHFASEPPDPFQPLAYHESDAKLI